MEQLSKEVARIVDFPANKESPFIPSLFIKKGKKNVVIGRMNKAIIDMATGEIEDTLFMGRKKELDKDQFVKIFHSHLQTLFDLSKATLKIFSYVASITEYGDKIIFDVEDCMKYTGYKSRETIYKSIADLLKAEIIARTNASNIYFINPQVFYKGDRILLITEYRKRRNDAIKDYSPREEMERLEKTNSA